MKSVCVFFPCVRLTTNGVVVRHQVLSPGWGWNTCQLKFGGGVRGLSIMAENCSRGKSCVSVDPISNAGLVLYCVIVAGNLPWAPGRPYRLLRCLLGIICCVLWIIPQLMQWGRAFPEATFWDLSAPLWWPFSQLLPFPSSVLLPARPSVQPYTFINARLTRLRHDYVWLLSRFGSFEHLFTLQVSLLQVYVRTPRWKLSFFRLCPRKVTCSN